MKRLTDADLRFLVETVAPEREDVDRVVELLRGKDDLIEPMLDDPRVIERITSPEGPLAQLSPHLLFTLLLRQVQRDLRECGYVDEIEGRGRRLPVFEADRVVELLDDDALREYLVALLCSFVRSRTTVVWFKNPRGWSKRRFSDLNLDDMIRLAQLAPRDLRPRFLRRAADLTLFYSGVFPDHLTVEVARPRTPFTAERTLRDYETEGRHYYELLARDPEPPELSPVFDTLSRHFTLARHALNTLSDRYLGPQRQRYFHGPQN